MILAEYYKYIEKINYKHYKIDDNHNLDLLNILENLIILSKENNIDLHITGGWAFVFKTDKIYRTLHDFDLILLKKDFIKWLQIFDKEFLFLYDGDLQEFINKSLQKKVFKFFRLKNKQYQKNIDVILTDKISTHLYFNKNFKKFNIKCRLPYKFLRTTNNYYFYNRDYDYDDFMFYSQYIK